MAEKVGCIVGLRTQVMPSTLLHASDSDENRPVPVPPSATAMYGHVAVLAHEPSSPRTGPL